MTPPTLCLCCAGRVAGLGVHEAHPLRPCAGEACAHRRELWLRAAVLCGDYGGQRDSPGSPAEHVRCQPTGEGAAAEGGGPLTLLLQAAGAAQDPGRDRHHAAAGSGIVRSCRVCLASGFAGRRACMAVVHAEDDMVCGGVAEVGALEFQRRLDQGILPLYTHIWHHFFFGKKSYSGLYKNFTMNHFIYRVQPCAI